MTATDLIIAALALWIVTHTVSSEIPVTAKAGKPFSCQLCLSGWIMIGVAFWTIVIGIWPSWKHDLDPLYLLQTGAIWAGSVLIEAVHQRMQTIII